MFQDIDDTIERDGFTLRARIEHDSEPDADLRESSSGYHCSACGREEADCSASPCEAVERDRAL